MVPQHVHFFKFRDIYKIRYLFSIILNDFTWSLSSPYAIQSSTYTSRKSRMKYYKVLTIILLNTIGAFFKPKGIIVHIKEPHSNVKFVLGFSSSFILLVGS